MIPPPLRPHPTSGDHDLNKLKSTPPKDASARVSGKIGFVKNFEKCLQFSIMPKYLPLRDGMVLHINELIFSVS